MFKPAFDDISILTSVHAVLFLRHDVFGRMSASSILVCASGGSTTSVLSQMFSSPAIEGPH
jgi:hypothetical protein